MAIDPALHELVDLVRAQREWAAPVAFTLAFAESLPFLSLLIPAWGALVAIGALLDASGISLAPVWLAGSIGAALGDGLSYWLGRKFKSRAERAWPFSRHPELNRRARSFVRRWGAYGVFVGRFLGPFRAVIPLVAGVLDMPVRRFQSANFLSAFLWVWTMLKLGGVSVSLIHLKITP